MFSREVQDRIELLLTEGTEPLVTLSDSKLCLSEKIEEGVAELSLNVQNECILFRDLEHKKLQYFKNGKCADYVLFERDCNEEKWLVHIFELKRTVTSKEWDHIKKQFAGALQNAFALAGVLGIGFSLSDVTCYTVYRNDKIRDVGNTVTLRHWASTRSTQNSINITHEWSTSAVMLSSGIDKKFSHKKIKLDIDTGKGAFDLLSNTTA